MPRIARLVCPGVPHHVTQRGNRRGQVFFSDADYRTYLAWLQFDVRRYHAEVLAYCLMPNHVHLVLVPSDKRSIEYVLRHLHMRYAQRANRQNGWNGHFWQCRYFSSPLDEPHFWAAVRYVELNPVRAGLATRAEGYAWSSAQAHCNASSDPVLSRDPKWTQLLRRINDWSAWLASGDDQSAVERIRKMTASGQACGSRQFVELLESRTGRNLEHRRGGRPRRTSK